MSAETSPAFASAPPTSVSRLATLRPKAPFRTGTFQFSHVVFPRRPTTAAWKFTIPSFPHETICHALERAAILDIAKMGTQTTDYVLSGATKYYQGQGGSGGGGSGEGDTTLVPIDCVLAEDTWPTFVVECGLSKSLHSLKNTMR
ncbi:hypothetical protein SPBR_03268 [Sporothrix brasiliensis 5110]|uniref:Uncharacterized protein n=1 Tax=Sporothrix brasiliensis 5110 TaxID=1398154 RepID=A0A0C2FQ98_9PEZI|nr:uncharacterized protein SPBR_03268 [Sporothrix brasiliensis 5110]KIH93203.1 hypothetical protein SPBR_03268 [Sporothrix brasiliensis 5110]